MTSPDIILASSSPQRKRLLAEAGYTFRIVEPGECEPDPAGFRDPIAYVSHTAWVKARQVAERERVGIILAADTVVCLSGQIIGKPRDREDARRILGRLSGSTHLCLTGVCVWLQPENYWIGGVEITELKMRELTSGELNDYLQSDRWVGKAGAYGIQDHDPYVSVNHGSHSNVVGLPIELVDRLLRDVRRSETPGGSGAAVKESPS